MKKFLTMSALLCSIAAMSQGEAQTPFATHKIPGIIEMENYDNGGENVAYHDNNNGNTGGAYRNDNVDLENCSTGGYNLGWISNGEWINYTLNSVESGYYQIKVKVATANPNANSSIKLSINDYELGTVNVNNTGGWQTWQTLSFNSNIYSSINTQVLKLEFTGGEFNVNSIEIVKFANAGDDIEITLPTNGITLDGSDSYAPIYPISYSWSQVSGPGTAIITNANAISTEVSELVAGSYVFQLTVSDRYTSKSDQVVVTVNPAAPQTPFATHNIPGVIESEDYDNGGNGVGYSDLTAGNAGGAYRTDDVDVVVSTDGGYSIGSIQNSEWLAYTINAIEEGDYTINFRVYSGATTSNAAITASIDGVVLGSITPAYEVHHPQWLTYSIENVNLSAGNNKVLKVGMSGSGYEISSVEFVKQAAPQTPFATHNIPGVIESEDYDNGGNGVGYSDLTAGNAGGAYRTDDVDVVVSTDGGYSIGSIQNSEWLAYTINAIEEGDYTINFRVYSGATTSNAAITASIDGVVLGSITPAYEVHHPQWLTYSIENVNLSAGNNKVLKVGMSGSGYEISSVEFVKQAAPQTPFVTHTIPGIIEMENYDNGGENVAYHDNNNGNTGGAYRNDNVDLENCSKGGYNLGWISNGEWVEYTISTVESGSYNLYFTTATANPNAGSAISVTLNGNNLGTVNINNTGGWQTWQTIELLNVTIAAGINQVLRIDFTGGEFNVNNIEFVKQENSLLREVNAEMENAKQSVNYWPNPVNDKAYINFKGNKFTSLNIIDLMGRTMFVEEGSLQNVNDISINMSTYNKGVYVVQLTRENGTIETLRVVKN